MPYNKALFAPDAEVTPENLGEAIQQAIEIEIATIPVYLYTYYSINRTPVQSTLQAKLLAALEKNGMDADTAQQKALELSAELLVFANKAGALIMSVVIEEMLHMALSSNLKQALIGHPQLTGKAPSIWPAYLPGHEPEFPINRAGFSLNQLMTFLRIESPVYLGKGQMGPGGLPYKTIGDFYRMIGHCIQHHKLTFNTEAPQLVPGKGYYAQNNVDTLYYTKDHKPRFANASDSGDLVHVVDVKSAMKAIDTISEQGEGKQDAPGLNPDGSVNCSVVPADYDDPSEKELSHFDKFCRLYCRYERLNKMFSDLKLTDDISEYVVFNMPVNPSTADYPTDIQPVSTLLNAVYTYIFVMTEACYRHPKGHTQYEIFMFGIHKSMIFILNSLCGSISALKYKGADGNTYYVAPTFENYTFDANWSLKAQLISLFDKAAAAQSSISYLKENIHALPDVSLK